MYVVIGVIKFYKKVVKSVFKGTKIPKINETKAYLTKAVLILCPKF